MTFHIANGDAINKESNTLLNLVVAGAGGLLAFVVGLIEKGADTWQSGGVAASSVFLFLGWLTGAILPLGAPDMPPANEPKNFPLEGYDLTSIRVAELNNRRQAQC